jgi:type II secretion system protein G
MKLVLKVRNVRYKALIIGINDYKGAKIPDLETPINDATALAKILKEKYGFKVQLLLDREATREAIYRGLRRLAASTEANDSVLIYFAGHGDLDRTYDDGWWIPADAIGGNPLTYLDNVQVQKAMRSMKARHVLLISDSCYSGTLFGKARSMPPVIDDKYYLSLYSEKSRWGMTSGNKTPVSDQGTGGHSVFAYQLLKELEKSDKPFLSTQELYTRIAPVIANNSEQTPLCRPILNTGDRGGEFVFVTSFRKKPTPTIPKVQMSSIDKDALFWKSIQDSDDPALFEAYIEAFPKGLFAPIAKRKIENLKQEKIIVSVPPDVSKSRLFVKATPGESRVRILNIGPKFQQGMDLDAGRYHVEISKQGYETKKMWVNLEVGKDKTLQVRLEKSPSTQLITSIELKEKSGHKVRAAKEQVALLQTALDIYELDVGKYPTTKQGLLALRIKPPGVARWNGPYIRKEIPHDPWGHAYVYRSPGKYEDFELSSSRLDASIKQTPKDSPPVTIPSASKVIARDGIYVAYANGIVKDTKTGLEWKVGPDKDTNWNEARSWVESLNLDGGGWKMPTMDELEGLFKKTTGWRNMTPLLKTNALAVWSSETEGSSKAKYFYFDTGSRFWAFHRNSLNLRAFAVRSRNDG